MNNRKSRSNNSTQPQFNFRNTRSKFYKKQSEQMYDNFDGNKKEGSEKNTGIYWKEQGNSQFKKGNFEKAIQYYSKAIEKSPSESVYFCNRAKCYKKLNKLKDALRDAEQACQLEAQNIKANYICGCILAQMGKYDKQKLSKAQNRLKKALRLCSSFKKQEFQDQISIKYFRLKKLIWYMEQQDQLQDLIVEKKQINSNNIDKETFDRICSRIDTRIDKIRLFQKNKQIPDHLCCKITLELMEEPVTTEQGLTYEKSALQDHFKTNGFFEPISRKKLQTKPYPNQALKNCIQDFLKENPWAFQDGAEQSFIQIQF